MDDTNTPEPKNNGNAGKLETIHEIIHKKRAAAPAPKGDDLNEIFEEVRKEVGDDVFFGRKKTEPEKEKPVEEAKPKVDLSKLNGADLLFGPKPTPEPKPAEEPAGELTYDDLPKEAAEGLGLKKQPEPQKPVSTEPEKSENYKIIEKAAKQQINKLVDEISQKMPKPKTKLSGNTPLKFTEHTKTTTIRDWESWKIIFQSSSRVLEEPRTVLTQNRKALVDFIKTAITDYDYDSILADRIIRILMGNPDANITKKGYQFAKSILEPELHYKNAEPISDPYKKFKPKVYAVTFLVLKELYEDGLRRNSGSFGLYPAYEEKSIKRLVELFKDYCERPLDTAINNTERAIKTGKRSIDKYKLMAQSKPKQVQNGPG